MSPKIPRKPLVPTPHKPVSTNEPSIRHDSDTPTSVSRGVWPSDVNTPSTSNQGHATRPGVDTSRPPAIEVTDLPTPTANEHSKSDSSLNKYWLPETFRRGTYTPDADGFRFIVGRKFVDVEYEGDLHIAHVGLDEDLGVYRVKLLTEQHPSGPIVYKNDASATWRMTEQPSEKPAFSHDESIQSDSAPKRPAPPASEPPETTFGPKRPRPSDTPNYIDLNHYMATWRSPDAQGYGEFEPRFHSDAADTLFALPGPFGKWIQVDPPVGGFGSQPTHLKHWTDAEIWELYGIHGQDIERFRAEAQGKSVV